MNNNFVISIPREVKNIKAKLFFGLTKRQLIGFICAGLIFFPIVFLLRNVSLDLAMLLAFVLAAPCIFIAIFKKNNLNAETWIKLYIEYNYIYKNKRKYKITKKNKRIAEERKFLKNV